MSGDGVEAAVRYGGARAGPSWAGEDTTSRKSGARRYASLSRRKRPGSYAQVASARPRALSKEGARRGAITRRLPRHLVLLQALDVTVWCRRDES